MADRQLSRFSLIAVLTSGLAFLAWTLLTFLTGVFARIDATSETPRLAVESAAAQIASAVALVTHPAVISACLLGLAIWAWQRRLRNIAHALTIGVLLAWPVTSGVKWLIGRQRPPSPLDYEITYAGSSYPSAHVAMVSAAAVLVIVTTTATRQSRLTIIIWRVISLIVVSLVALDRWIMNAHWFSDIIGGLFWGFFVAGASLIVAGVHMTPPELIRHHRPSGRQGGVCAIIYNPSKVLDMTTFRRHVHYELLARGWDDPLWLTTKRDDPGFAMTRQALDQHVDLILAAGGDGTVRAVCSELANTSTPLALIPAGTGNLLARNLGIPKDEVRALEVALDGVPRKIDLIKVTFDDDHDGAQHFTVMAGIGIDAQIMSHTNSDLKKMVGSVAYFLSAAQQMGMKPMDLRYQVDDGKEHRRKASLALVGNVGQLQGGIQMFPDASPTDGKLDIMVASPAGVMDWAQMAAQVITRQRRNDDRVDERTGKKVVFTVAQKMPYELDGDTEGEGTRMEAEVVPEALILMMPKT